MTDTSVPPGTSAGAGTGTGTGDGAGTRTGPASALGTPGDLRGTLIERMGLQFVEIGADHLVARMPVEGNTQPYGLLHGGASCVLAETLGSVGAATHAASFGGIAVGLDINATHHRAARSGFVTGVADAISLGRSVASYQVVITDDEGRRICTARISCLIRPKPPGA